MLYESYRKSMIDPFRSKSVTKLKFVYHMHVNTCQYVIIVFSWPYKQDCFDLKITF